MESSKVKTDKEHILDKHRTEYGSASKKEIYDAMEEYAQLVLQGYKDAESEPSQGEPVMERDSSTIASQWVNSLKTNAPDKSERTVLVKRSIDEDGLPKENGNYFVIDPNGVILDEKIGARFSLYGKEWHCQDGDIVHPSHWYEEIPFSSLIEEVMPSKEEEDDATTAIISKWYYGDNTVDVKVERAVFETVKWLKNKLASLK